MKLTFLGDISPFRAGILDLAPQLGIKPTFGECGEALAVTIEKGDPDKLSVRKKGGSVTITYDRRIHFFRALGLLVEHLRVSDADFTVAEDVYFTMNGPMYDVSQGNAVINVKSVKCLLRTMAVMGLNMLMLYCEDSYAVPEEPYFGHMRAKYTEADMRELDDYADMLGIEIIPCIQTLAHLIDTMHWTRVYGDIREDGECLLVGEEKTYEFIRRLLVAATKPFRTKRIHIGMDEAWRLGLGKYLEKHGLTSKTEIMRIHLARVMEIIRELGLEPMMWSDMFFRAIIPGGGYYDETIEIPQATIDAVPEGMSLVYWDYYHYERSFYESYIAKHRQMANTVFAGGIWTWLGYGANWAKTFDTSYPAAMACKKENCREVIITVWGDDGTENNIFSTLPGLQFYAEHGYRADPSLDEIASRFDFCTGAKWDDFMAFQGIDTIPPLDPHERDEHNCSKFLMWQDILTGLFDKNIEGLPLDEHYENLAAALANAATRNGEYNELMRYNYHVADVLSLKSEIGLRLTAAYKRNATVLLEEYASDILPDLYERVEALRLAHKSLWYATYKSLGWDTMDLRYGGLLIRIQTAIEQIEAYLGGDKTALGDLDEPRLPYNGVTSGIPTYINNYGDIVSAGRFAHRT
ncbi:MAG: beta-N-acetylhexosaminidase [Clostridiaceae bacterium]|nr:beta-N-acetylhexosaminidase [Clostridiaceae bacterium]